MGARGASMDVAVGESVSLSLADIKKMTERVDNDRITITLEQKSGQRARLRIEAPPSIAISKPARR